MAKVPEFKMFTYDLDIYVMPTFKPSIKVYILYDNFELTFHIQNIDRMVISDIRDILDNKSTVIHISSKEYWEIKIESKDNTATFIINPYECSYSTKNFVMPLDIIKPMFTDIMLMHVNGLL